MQNIEKAYAISDAKISFVSLVDKAANKKQFLITKAAGSSANFQSFGRILKTDDNSHFVTGVVYEPMAEDTDGNYMTAEEIEKAAHWFMKNDGDVDIQHCFEKAEGVDIVESFVAKNDMEIEGQKIAKGTWLMTMEVSNDAVWDAIIKGDITGFSMGGVGNFSQEDVDLEQVEKSAEPRGLFRKLAKALGMEVVEKGAVKDTYKQRIKSENFWTAYSSLENVLRTEVYQPGYGYQYVYTDNEDIIREALTDFNEIITNLLDSNNLAGELEKAAKEGGVIEKAGKSLSSKNLATLQEISTSLADFLSGFTQSVNDSSDNEGSGDDAGIEKSGNKDILKKEEAEMTHDEVKTLVEESVTKAMDPIVKQLGELTKGSDGNDNDENDDSAAKKDAKKKDVSADDVIKMVSDAVTKAMDPIQLQLDVIKKSRALPSNLNGEHSAGTVEKSSEHYLHGIL